MFEVLVPLYMHGNSIETIAQPRSFWYSYLYVYIYISVHLYQETYRIPETFPIAAMTAWDIVPEEKPGFCRSQGLRCSKYGVPNGMGMYMCRFIKCSMTTS